MDIYAYRPDGGLLETSSLSEVSGELGRDEVEFWIDIPEDNFEEEVAGIGDLMDFHPLSTEDVLTAEGRSTLEIFDNYLYLLVRTPVEVFEPGEMESGQLSLFLGSNFLVSCHRRKVRSVESLKVGVKNNPGRFLGRGSDYLAYQVLDRSVDNYLLLMEKIEDNIDSVEDEVFADPDEELLSQMSDLRSDLLYLQRMVGPQREVVAKLSRPEIPFIREDRKVYFRDIQDNLARLHDLLTNYRELLGGARDMYMTVMSNEMNEIMQTLTIVATIFIPLTFVAGIYGMNFELMPELDWSWGYFGSLGVMGTMAAGMLYYFKRKDWF